MKISHLKVLITFLYHIDTTFPETIKIIRPLDRKKWKYGIDSFHMPQSVCNLENRGNRGYCNTTSCSIDETGNYSRYLCSCSKENSTVTYFKDRWRCMKNEEVRKQFGRYFIFICKITDQWESSSDGHTLVMNQKNADNESLSSVNHCMRNVWILFVWNFNFKESLHLLSNSAYTCIATCFWYFIVFINFSFSYILIHSWQVLTCQLFRYQRRSETVSNFEVGCCSGIFAIKLYPRLKKKQNKTLGNGFVLRLFTMRIF